MNWTMATAQNFGDCTRRANGFTLIELLIVLAIMAILVGIVALSVNDLPAAADVRAREREVDIVEKAIDAYITHDMIAEGSMALTARPYEKRDVIRPEDAAVDAEFARYLRRETKYAYWWDIDTSGPITVALHQVE